MPSRAAIAALALFAAAPLVARAQLGAPILRGQPTAEDVRRAYPPRARAEHVGGRVVIGCEVAPTGRLERCAVVSETPAGYGFGQAALSLSGRFLMEPKIEAGRAVAGGSVRLPIVFSLPDQAVKT